MQYIHIKNLDQYHPGYRDRKLMWARVYFTMFNAEPELEICCEIDKFRYIFFIITELQTKKPLPIIEPWLTKKGLDLKVRPLAKTLKALSPFLAIQGEADKKEVKVVPSKEPKPPPQAKNKYLEFVELTPDEFMKLQEVLGGKIEDYIKRLDGYIGQIGIRKARSKYTSHYHTILNWYRKDIKEGVIIEVNRRTDTRTEDQIIADRRNKRNAKADGGAGGAVQKGSKDIQSPFARQDTA